MKSLSLYKIQRVARIMTFAASAAGVASISLIVWLWASPERLEAKLIPILHLAESYHLDADVRLHCFTVTLIPLALLLFLFWHVYRLFSAYGAGEIFTIRTARHLRFIAIAVGTLGCIRPLLLGFYRSVLSVPTMDYSIRIGIGDILTILFAGLLFAIALVLAEAARLREENEGFV